MRTVELEIGALRQVVPEALRYTWGFVTAGTTLAGARLAIREVPLIIECESGHTRRVRELYEGLKCAKCDRSTRIVTGQEFTVVALDVDAGTVGPLWESEGPPA